MEQMVDGRVPIQPGEPRGAQLQLSLYENAVDSIRHAIEHYTSDTREERRYKYAILHLAQGVALLLKERLRREHPRFVFANVADESKTVDIDLAISRLQKIAGLELGASTQLIKELAALRNKIEHYAIDVPKQQADSIIGRVVPFLVSFTHDELQRDIRYEIGPDNWQALLAIRGYLDSAIQAAENAIASEGKTAFFCDRCQAHTAREVPDPWRRSVSDRTHVVCAVCYTTLQVRESCHGCGLEMVWAAPREGPVRHGSYCEACTAKIREEFPDYELPELVAEVRRWFLTHETVSADQLMDLLFATGMCYLGPTGRPRLIIELYTRGAIDFVYDSAKEEYLATRHIPGVALKPCGFHPHTEFKWALGGLPAS